MVLDNPLDSLAIDAASVSGGQPQPLFSGNGLLQSGLKPWQKLRPSIEILCNSQASQTSRDPTIALFLVSINCLQYEAERAVSLWLFQVLSPDMSLATVRAYVWKKPEDLILNYRVAIAR